MGWPVIRLEDVEKFLMKDRCPLVEHIWFGVRSGFISSVAFANEMGKNLAQIANGISISFSPDILTCYKPWSGSAWSIRMIAMSGWSLREA